MPPQQNAAHRRGGTGADGSSDNSVSGGMGLDSGPVSNIQKGQVPASLPLLWQTWLSPSESTDCVCPRTTNA